MRFCLFLFCLSTLPLLAQSGSFPLLHAQQLLGTQRANYPQKICLSSDSCLVLAGHSVSYDKEKGTDIHLIKTDKQGEIIWNKTLEMGGDQELRDITAVANGGFIFVGVTNSGLEHEEKADEPFYADAWVGCLDKEGRTLWLKTLGGSQSDLGNSIITDGEEVWVAGGSFSSDRDVLLNYGGSDIWLFRLDMQGELKFLKTIGGSGNEWANALTRCKNGDIVLAGYTNSPEMQTPKTIGRNGQALIIRLKRTGTIVWSKTFESRFGGYFTGVKEDPEGNIVAAGSCFQAPDNRDYWLVQLNERGETLKEVKFGSRNDECLNALELTSDSAWVLAGYSADKGDNAVWVKGKEDVVLFKFGKEFKPIWQHTYGGPDYEKGVDVCEYEKGKYAVLAEKDNYFVGTKDGNKDFWLVQVEEKSCKPEVIGGSITAKTVQPGKFYAFEQIQFQASCNFGAQFMWDFGDGTFSKEKNPAKTYKQAGTYRPQLMIQLGETCRQIVQFPQAIEVKE